ncbi:MAG: RipA family octameric membrane protein [Acidobacteriota bacterium]
MSSPYDQYKAALEGRREDSTRYWTVLAVMSAVNGAMLAFIKSDSETRIISVLRMSGFGVLLCLVWLSLQPRLSAWVRWWEQKLVALEASVPAKERLFTDRSLGSTNPFRVGFSTRVGGVGLPLLFVVAWRSRHPWIGLDKLVDANIHVAIMTEF